MEILLKAVDLTKRFPFREHPLGKASGWIEAVKGINLSIRQGESVGLVGESGCGKSTLARLLCRLLTPSSGTVLFRGRPINGFRGEELLQFRRSVQMIFQDPLSSLDPLMRIGQIVAEPLVVHRQGGGLTPPASIEKRTESLLTEVGLNSSLKNRFPQTLSGGQRQRVGIARALALNPKVLICDEPVSSLDLSVQAQILALLTELQKKRSLSLLFISHNLATVSAMADRVLVMKAGQIIEEGPNPQLFATPRDSYTRQLVKLALKSI